MPDYDPRIVSLYDIDNPDGPDHDLYRSLVDAAEARDVVDLGCGTGLLTRSLTGPGRTVTGVDPSPTMLAWARTRPGGAEVSWLQGDSSAIAAGSADFVLMTGNVAQHILGESWPRALADISRALRPGGHLAFESRNPGARAWAGWTAEQTLLSRRTHLGQLREWLEPAGADGDVRAFDCHTVFLDTDDHHVERLTLAFRSEATIRGDLAAAGLAVADLWGGWHREPLRIDSRVMVFHARQPG